MGPTRLSMESKEGTEHMAITRKEEARALSADERELVDRSHHPALQELGDNELRDLVRLVRERRERAKALAHQRRREMRGKSAPRGVAAATADEGSRDKVAVLAMAMRRLNSEIERRRRMAAQVEFVGNAHKALAMKQAQDEAGVSGGSAENSRRAHEGMRNLAGRSARSLIRPMERGRLRKAGAVAQARRDAR